MLKAINQEPMSPEANYAYHRQDNDQYCGAACVQMILQESRQLDSASLYRDQAYIDSLFQPVGTWRVAPEELVRVLNQAQGAVNWSKVETLCDPADPETAGMDMLTRLMDSAVGGMGAALVPVRQFDHWVVMTGRGLFPSLIPIPVGGGGSVASAHAEWHVAVNDPWPPLDLTTPVIHSGPIGGLCESLECAISIELWGPVFLSDFLEQRRLLSLSEYYLGIVGAADVGPPSIDEDAFATALVRVPYDMAKILPDNLNETTAAQMDNLNDIATSHVGHLKSYLPNSLWAQFTSEGIVAEDVQEVSAPSTQSRYPARYQFTINGFVTVPLPSPSLPWIVPVKVLFEICAYTGVLSRLRVLPNDVSNNLVIQRFKYLNVSNFGLK